MPSSSSYPTTIDAFTGPTDTLGGPNGNAHDDAHRHLNDAVLKLETELGTTPRGTSATVAERLSTVQTSANQVVAALSGTIASVTGTSIAIVAGGTSISSVMDSTSYWRVRKLGGLTMLSMYLKFTSGFTTTGTLRVDGIPGVQTETIAPVWAVIGSSSYSLTARLVGAAVIFYYKPSTVDSLSSVSGTAPGTIAAGNYFSFSTVIDTNGAAIPT